MRRLPPFVQVLLTSMLLTAPFAVAPAASKFDLTPAQKERIAKFLPHTYPKLAQHAPVHVMLLGDSITGMYVHDDNDNNTLKSYGGVFVNQLADQFYYTGGVHVERPYRGTPEKTLPIYGPEIFVRNASRGGKLIIHAMNVLDTSTWDDSPPDLVVVNFGVNDANSFFDYGSYRQGCQEVIDTVRKHGADVILLGCTITMTDPPEFGMALTRPYADIAHEVADANGVFYADLGDMTWLVRVDEPMKGLEKPKKTDPAPPQAAPSANAPAAPSLPQGNTPGTIVKFPTPEELDPDPEKRAARLFKAVSDDMRAWYDHGGQTDLIHPNSHLHKLLGRRIFSELLDGPRKVPWAVGGATAEFKDANTFTLTYRVENKTDEPLRVSILPLITTNWRPQEADTQLELKPQRKGPLTVTYARVDPSSINAIPAQESLLRLPIMVLGSGVARIETLRSLVQPFSVHWDMGTQFNVEDEFTINGQVDNTNGDELSGTWEAEWLGQKLSGKVQAPAHKASPFVLRFKFPVDTSKISRERGTLSLSVTAHGITIPFKREIEVVRNMGLKDPVPLLKPDDYALNQPKLIAMPDALHSGVTFRADADPKALYFTWDFVGMNLVEDTKGHAVTFEMNIDARSYGKRLKYGITDALRFYCGAADGEGVVNPVQAWSFGNGYGNQRIDFSQIQTHLSSRPDGSRRFTIMFPRSFFHLHEWALGNGNSELGFNMTLLVGQKGDEPPTPFLYSQTNIYRDDAQALCALELSEHPTKRWTVHFF